MQINVTLPLVITPHVTTTIGPDGERKIYWYSISLMGRDLGLGSEVENYRTPAKRDKAARSAARRWAASVRERAKILADA
jgi:hypothetical protein